MKKLVIMLSLIFILKLNIISILLSIEKLKLISLGNPAICSSVFVFPIVKLLDFFLVRL